MKAPPVIRARPTLYKGIKMRSRLEADFAGALDRDEAKWEYEPTCFAGPDDQWLPDFRCDDVAGLSPAYIEVKPSSLFDYDTPTPDGVYERVDKVLRKMSVAWLSNPDAYLVLVFWTYGLPDVTHAPLQILGHNEAGEAGPPAWLAHTPTNLEVPLLWPGMGQMSAASYRPGGLSSAIPAVDGEAPF